MGDQIKEKILEKIKSGEIKMHSRTYFLIHTVLLIFSLIIIFFVGWFLISILFFLFNKTGAWHLSIFGIKGFLVFLSSFSWIIIISGLAFLVIFEVMLRKFPIGYRSSLLYSVIFLLAVVLIGNTTIHATGLNNKLHNFLQKKKIPVVEKIYELQGEFLKKNMVSGYIEEITPDGFILNDSEKGSVKVKTNSSTKFPSGHDLKIGEEVYVGVGKTDGGKGEEVTALGVEKMDEEEIKEQKKREDEKNEKRELEKLKGEVRGLERHKSEERDEEQKQPSGSERD